MSFRSRGSMAATVTVSRLPDGSGNFICDGTADDVQIQAAIDYVEGLFGGLVFIEQGDYDITAPLIMDVARVALEGTGRDTVLILADNVDDNMIEVTASYCKILNMVLTGNSANNAAGSGIVYECPVAVGSIEELEIGSVRISDFDEYGILGTGSAGHLSNVMIVHHVTVATCFVGVYVADYSWAHRFTDVLVHNNLDYGFWIVGSGEHHFSNCQSWDNGDHGFIAFGAVDMTWMGGYIHTNVGSGMSFQGDSTNITVSGVVIRNNSFGAPGTDHGIRILETCSHITITGCEILDDQGTQTQTYGVRATVSTDNIVVVGNDLTRNRNGSFSVDGGANTMLFDNKVDGTNIIADGVQIPTLVLSFVEGTTLLSAAPFGWEIDANTEYALALGHLPLGVQQVFRWKIWASSLVAEADAMRLEIEGYGGASNEPYTTETVAVADHPSETTNFAVNDVIYWLLDATDDADIDDMVGGDQIMIKVLHEAGGGADVETDAVFTCVEIEYV